MSYTALYRKFRPSAFEDVKGQDHIVTTLKNQMKAGRIGHAYLFCGTRGTGKTTVAKILAKAVNCEHPVDGSPCNACPSCQAIQAGRSTNVIEIDAASNNGVDNIREIREEVSYRPTQGRYKVYIIDEVHMLSTGAFNALLKTLEEPPEYVIFILATTEANKIPVTILSRCQRYDFRRITIDTISARLKDLMEREGVEAEEKALRYVARKADGSMRDALSLLDQCIAFYMGETLTYDAALDCAGNCGYRGVQPPSPKRYGLQCGGKHPPAGEADGGGKEMGQLVSDFTWYMRNLLLVKTSEDLEDVLDVSGETLQRLREESAMADEETLMRYIRVFSELSGQLRYSAQKRVLTEIALIRLCRPQMETGLDSVLERVRAAGRKNRKRPAGGRGSARRDTRTGRTRKRAGSGTGFKSRSGGSQRDPGKMEDNRGTDYASFKIYLQSAVPRYDGNTGEAKLFLMFSDKTAHMYVNRPEKIQEIRRAIRETAGRDVEIEILPPQTAGGRHLAEIPLEEMIREAVHMPVEVEDLPEEEEE